MSSSDKPVQIIMHYEKGHPGSPLYFVSEEFKGRIICKDDNVMGDRFYELTKRVPQTFIDNIMKEAKSVGHDGDTIGQALEAKPKGQKH